MITANCELQLRVLVRETLLYLEQKEKLRLEIDQVEVDPETDEEDLEEINIGTVLSLMALAQAVT